MYSYLIKKISFGVKTMHIRNCGPRAVTMYLDIIRVSLYITMNINMLTTRQFSSMLPNKILETV